MIERPEALLRRLAQGVARLERASICCGSFTSQQFETLRVIRDARELSTNAVAERLEIDLSTASRNLSILERDGYVRRVRTAEDSRRVVNRLSAKGARCVETLCCDERTVFASVFARIPKKDRAGVLDALRALATALEGEPPNCCAVSSAPNEGATCHD